MGVPAPPASPPFSAIGPGDAAAPAGAWAVTGGNIAEGGVQHRQEWRWVPVAVTARLFSFRFSFLKLCRFQTTGIEQGVLVVGNHTPTVRCCRALTLPCYQFLLDFPKTLLPFPSSFQAQPFAALFFLVSLRAIRCGLRWIANGFYPLAA